MAKEQEHCGERLLYTFGQAEDNMVTLVSAFITIQSAVVMGLYPAGGGLKEDKGHVREKNRRIENQLTPRA